MLKYILKRLALLIPILIGVTFIVFALLYLSPGDPARAILGRSAPQEAVDALRGEMGLNDPFIVQYGRFLYDLVIHRNLGTSYLTKAPVFSALAQVIPYTIELTLLGMSIAIVLGMSLGVLSAVKKYTWIDHLTNVFGLAGLSMPTFWLGLMLILFFSVQLNLLPSSGFETPAQKILPAFALSAQSIAIILRMTRSSMLDVLNQDYIRTARAKGLRQSRVVIIHALKNTMMPVATSIGLQIGGLFGGAVLTETIFSIPGVGRLMVDSIKTRDYPLVLGGVLFIALSYSLINLLVDILYGFIDPKTRSQYR